MSRIILAILDGFGLNNTSPEENAIQQANAPLLKKLLHSPHAKLAASGLAVGIPEGQMGNSEVGHITIGAGRTILQGTVKIDASLSSGAFAQLPEYSHTLNHIAKNNGSLHLLTLFGPGGVHASELHLKKILATLSKETPVFLHLFTDGRDLAPTSAQALLKEFEKTTLCACPHVKIASLSGRYFAMDRDNNYARVHEAYKALTGQTTVSHQSAQEVIAQAYSENKTDEFIAPTLLTSQGAIQSGDAIWFLNFRSDRARMLTETFYEETFSHFERAPLANTYFVSMVPYYQSYTGPAFFRDEPLTDTLGEVLATNNISQLRIAETEKFAHVTKFFNGGRFEAFKNEIQKLIPSHKVATYDLDPAMSADEITAVIEQEGLQYQVIVVNYANGDMVGHTGSLTAAIAAVESLEQNVAKLLTFAQTHGYEILLTADHGNCEEMGTSEAPKTSHTTNLVPCWHIVDGTAQAMAKNTGTLANIAPSVLTILGIKKPNIMEESLI